MAHDAASDASGAASAKGMFSRLKGFGESLKKKVGGFFAEEEDEDVPVMDRDEVISDEGDDKGRVADQLGSNYELSFAYHAFPSAHPKSYYFTSQLGDPFPSYHSNPDPFFPPRWTSIPGVRIPVENLSAPRIRLAPKELEARYEVLDALKKAALLQEAPLPKPKVINLCSQRLGDPYQTRALSLFLELNQHAEVVNLADNELEDISQLDSLKYCKKLFLHDNNIPSFTHLPATLPALEELVITHNFITTFDGFDAKRFPKLKIVKAYGNPIFADECFAEEMVKAVPTLRMVDWIDAKRARKS